jgi:hypothetical protein
MVMNRLQKDLINACIALRASSLNSKKKINKWEHIFFFSNYNRDFYSENSNVSQVYTYIPKIQKKNCKNATTYHLYSILR